MQISGKSCWCAVLIVLSLLLGACSEEGGGTVGTDGILSNLRTTNLDSSQGYWSVEPEPAYSAANGRLKRWAYETSGLIPVKLNGSATASQALDRIESTLGLVLFDRTSIASTPDDNITRGIIVSEGTALNGFGGVDATACGHVSANTTSTNWFFDWYDSTGEVGRKVYLNLGSPGCAPSVDIAIHEFGHALGMGEHFSGFGIGPPIDNNFWNVLFNIYNNNVGEAETNLTITRQF